MWRYYMGQETTLKNKSKKTQEIKIKPKYDKYGSASRNLIYYMIKD